jgi:hypothetical protein
LKLGESEKLLCFHGSDGAEIGLNAAASGMQISDKELSKLSCRNLTIGGINSHVRIGALPPKSLAGIVGYVVIRALSAGADAHVGVEGKFEHCIFCRVQLQQGRRQNICNPSTFF